MNFAYLDPRSLLETVLIPPMEPIDPVPCDLDESWKDLGETLTNFKREYARVRADLAMRMAELAEKKDETNVIKLMLENVNSQDLKERLESMLDDYENEQNLQGLTRECGELSGRSQAMKKILEDTDPERYARFTCFVCLDRHIDLFIDPCGHVICEPCWVRTQNKATCPGCRARINGTKRIFSMN
jgi:Sec-independent protein translocase protein TatA